MTQAFEHKDTMQSSEDQVTKRHLKFLMYLIEAAANDPEWQADLKEKAEQFGRIDN